MKGFRRAFKYILLLGLFWFTAATLMPFITTIFHGFGYENALIGRLMMIAGLCSMVAAPVWGSLCDSFQKVRAILIFCAAGGMASAAALPFAAERVWVAAVTVVIFYLTFMALSYILDVWVIRLASEGEPINYASVRAFGSLGYAIGGPLGGWLIASYGVGHIPVVFPLLSVSLIAVSLFIRNPKKIAVKGETQSVLNTAKALAGNRTYRFFLLACFLVFLGTNGVYSFLPIHMIGEKVGGTSRSYGIFIFLTGAVEVPMLFIYKRLSRMLSHGRCLAIALFFQFARLIIVGLAPNMAVMYLATLAYMLSWGLHIGAVGGFLPEIVNVRLLFTAQTVSQAFASGMASIISNFFAGSIADSIGVDGMILRFSMFPLAGFFVFILFCRKKVGRVVNDSATGD